MLPVLHASNSSKTLHPPPNSTSALSVQVQFLYLLRDFIATSLSAHFICDFIVMNYVWCMWHLFYLIYFQAVFVYSKYHTDFSYSK